MKIKDYRSTPIMRKKQGKSEEYFISFRNRLKTYLLTKSNNIIYIWVALKSLSSNTKTVFHYM